MRHAGDSLEHGDGSSSSIGSCGKYHHDWKTLVEFMEFTVDDASGFYGINGA